MSVVNPALRDYVALAIVVLKSKPPAIGVEDYIRALRNSLTSKQQGQYLTSSILNTCKLWHSLFLHTQQQNIHLLAELAASSDEKEIRLPRKRLSHDVLEGDAITQLKRQKLESPVIVNNGYDLGNAEEQHEDRTRLLHVIWSLARLMNRQNVDNQFLIQLVDLACDSVIQVLIKANDRTFSKKSQPSEPLVLNEACIAAKNIWSVLISQRPITSAQNAFAIDMDLVMPRLYAVFHFFLGSLHKRCLDEAEATLKTAVEGMKAKKSREETLIGEDTRRKDLFKHNCSLLTFTLNYMVATVSKLDDVQESSFKPMISTFLRHLGASMSLYLFGDTESVRGGNVPRRRADSDNASHKETTESNLATKLEAPYLVSILKSLMLATRTGNSSPDACAVTIFDQSLGNLQRMLLNGVFGNANGIVMPTLRNNGIFCNENSQTELFSHKEENDPDWFLSQIWNILGWDILLRNDFNSFPSTDTSS